MSPRKKLPILLCLPALAALLLAACGGGGSSSDTTAKKPPKEPAALTKAELITQGDAICAEVNSAVGSVGSSAATPEAQTEQVANLYSNMIQSIKNLGAPKEKSSEYTEFIAAANEFEKVESEIKLAAEREDQVKLEEAGTSASAALAEFQSAAAAYGFEACAEEASAPPPASGGESEGEGGEEGGIEVEPEIEEVLPEEVPEEIVPETGGAGGEEEAPPVEEGGGESSGGVGPG